MAPAFGRAIREAGKAIALVLLALGLLLLVLLAGTSSDLVRPRTERVRSDLAAIGNAAELYRMRTHRLPNADGGIDELVRSRILKEAPIDPWGHPFHYAPVDGAPLIMSFGADGRPGGEGDDADVTSLDLNSGPSR